MNWFKFYGQEYLTDPKMMNLTPVEKAIWLTMLCLASQDDGVIKYADSAKIMILTGIMPGDPDFINYYDFLDKFEKLSMITNDNEMITIKSYHKRQSTNLSPYERTKKHREKVKSEAKYDNKDNVINDNARLDKNRLDKNIKESKEKYPLSYLKDFPIKDFEDIEATENQLRLEADKAYNWLVANNKKKANHKAYLRIWVLKTYKKRPPAVEQPKAPDDISEEQRQRNLQHIKDIRSKLMDRSSLS